MFDSADVYQMFMDTFKAVYDFLRTAKFMNVSLLSVLVTTLCCSILISGLVNIVQRAPIETGTASNNRIRANRRREENFHTAERRHRERMEQNERLRRRK